ncbi:flavodoxin domain-containing protein [Blastococcus xanthinilyticus]|uniref:Menaquinone-dependent protoporphyrinogen oxidase n=1 Tax=Blastococcus xanthinilyticus TaxID=1564164 RepID=A0A5S5D307_9ACTN|nr:flavodoxin domain-containing protein [Blastococcus xanthinilyticus]TYP89546.1 menaquinone-dependent protoporphyrinogen oxidase [Blastococcus xanthinilyticus]
MTDSLVMDPGVAAAVPVLRTAAPARAGLLPFPAVAGGGPRVLVVFASRHGATREIAAELARWSCASEAGRGGRLTAALAPVELQPDPSAFDAVVVGSALYSGRWLEPARRYLADVAPELSRRPTWLFSSGLGGDQPWGPGGEDAEVRAFGDRIGARGHRAFPGRLERRLLSAAERSVWPAGSAAGDLRDWRAVRGWAEEIAAGAVARCAVPVPG